MSPMTPDPSAGSDRPLVSLGLADVAPRRRTFIVAGAIGNMLEWYDFAAYGYFSIVIGRNFFPSDNYATSLLAAFAVFAAAFFMRPIGSLLFGFIGDRFGRKSALVLSAGLMAVSTCLIGCLPTYATAGVVGPVLLVVLRLAQGLSVGGEYTTSAIFLAENADPSRRGLVGSLACIGASGGILLGSIVGVILSGVLTPDQVRDWGWRLPFLLGIGLGGFIFVLRRRMDETHVEEAHPQDTDLPGERWPLREALAIDGLAMLRAFAMCIALAVSFYVVFVYLVTFMHTQGGLSQNAAFVINTIAMVVLTAAVPMMGLLSDRIGRKRVLIVADTGLVLLSWPLFAMIASGRPAWMLLAQVIFAILVAGYSAVIPTTLVEMLHRHSRCTAMATSYNAAMALAGGTAPMVATWLVHDLRLRTGPGLLVAALSLVSLGATMTMRDQTGRSLD